MRDLTNQIDAAVARLPDLDVLKHFQRNASPCLYADGIGRLLGNIAEQAVADVLKGTVVGKNNKGFDVLLKSGVRAQVKSRLRTTYRQNSQFMKGNPESYDTWIGISFNHDFSVQIALQLTAQEVQMFGSSSRFTEQQLIKLADR